MTHRESNPSPARENGESHATWSRRAVVQTGAGAFVGAAFAPYVAASRRAFAPDGSEVLRVGLVGCGGRGTGAAAQALVADDQVKLVAVADTFRDHLDNCLDALSKNADVASRVDVDEEHKFVGFDGFRGVIESSDVVLFATPPHFRPQQVRAAVEAGKHTFVEKPVAVDAPGIRSILESARLAQEQGLSMVSGLCYRYQHAKRATLERIHGGAIGDIVAMQTSYNTGGLWYRDRKPDWTEMEHQVRNWLYYTWLSGDHINEQHVHSLDKLAWAMGDNYPVRCTSSGGRSVRTEEKWGNIYDHFNTVFEWGNGVRGFSSCRQWNGASSDVSDHCFGTKGTAHIQTHQIDGESKWRWRSDEPDDMYQNEHDELFAAIRAGAPINNGHYMAKSTLMAIMARMSAYTGETVTWEQALASELDLTPERYAWGDVPAAAVAVPGVTKFT